MAVFPRMATVPRRTYMASLNRTELVAAVAAESGQSQAAVNGVLDALFSTLAKSVAAGDKVTIPGWLAVEQTSRAARTGRNPQTGEPIEIAASKGVKISAGSKLRSEEHTSELQSRQYLVCRLLLEKKKRLTATAGT